MNSFITLYFSYCPVVCMIHSRNLNERINPKRKNSHTHGSALRIVCQDFKLSF